MALVNVFSSTSPSVYVGFSAMYAVDRCGPIGTYIPYTMLAFAPGELSTIEWPVWDRGSIPPGATKSFNFADLPCPPQNVMVSLWNWTTPEWIARALTNPNRLPISISQLQVLRIAQSSHLRNRSTDFSLDGQIA